MPKVDLAVPVRKSNQVSIIALILFISQLTGGAAANAVTNHVPHCRINNQGVSTKVVSGVYQIHIDTFTPNTNFCFLVPSSSNGNYSSTDPSISAVQNLDHAVAINYTQPTYVPLNSSDTPIATISSTKGLRIIQIFALPTNFPQFSTIGNKSTLSGLNILTTPLFGGLYYGIAIEGNQVAFWTSSKYTITGFRQLNDSPKKSTPSSYEYSYLSASNATGNYTPGTWHFLNNAFQEVGEMTSLELGGTTLLPEGHDMTLSRAANPVVFSYVSREVDSSWLSNPLSSPSILDCEISEVQNGTSIHSFSFWDWASSHKVLWKQLINNSPFAGFSPTIPVYGTAQTATDIFHCNSIQYLPSKNQYLISLRGLSSILLLNGDLSSVQDLITFPGAGEHFARSSDGLNFTAFGNYPDGQISEFISWTFGDPINRAQFLDLPISSRVCANMNVLNGVDLWFGGGCGTLTNESNTLLIPKTVTVVGEYISEFKTNPIITSAIVINGFNSYTYRTDLFTPSTPANR